MLLSAVSVLVVAQSSSEIPEGPCTRIRSTVCNLPGMEQSGGELRPYQKSQTLQVSYIQFLMMNNKMQLIFGLFIYS